MWQESFCVYVRQRSCNGLLEEVLRCLSTVGWRRMDKSFFGVVLPTTVSPVSGQRLITEPTLLMILLSLLVSLALKDDAEDRRPMEDLKHFVAYIKGFIPFPYPTSVLDVLSSLLSCTTNTFIQSPLTPPKSALAVKMSSSS